ncbi:hypothetical protein MTO96_029276, partial [Rhipicephalus appendiculatus]
TGQAYVTSERRPKEFKVPVFRGAVMSAVQGGGQPLDILNVKGRSLELSGQRLKQLLQDKRFKDKPVVVIAVVGAFRTGKSFLLCFMLRYLRKLGTADWLGDPDAPLEGFDWRGGSEPLTSGILVWDEVFTELAVLLVDTQGTFDCKSPKIVHSSIFALSAMISSVLVYNITDNIREDNLQHLQAFVEYGMMLQYAQQQKEQQYTTEEVGCLEPFQSLLFLVRDWRCAHELPYGVEGGKKLLKRRRLSDTQDQDQDEELRQLRQKLSQCFKETRCFLMPHPGLKVTEERPNGCCLLDIREDFKKQLPDLMELLLKPDNLHPKEINGRKITCQELMSYIEVYVSATNVGLLRDPSHMLEVTYIGIYRAAMEKSLDFYMTSMIEKWQSSHDSITKDALQGHHEQLRERAVQRYSAAPKIDGKEHAQVYLDKLTEKIGAIFGVYCEHLKKRREEFVKNTAIKVVHGIATTGLLAAAIAVSVVELPFVAAGLAAGLAVAGVASIGGHIIHVVVEKKHARLQLMEGQQIPAMAAEAAERVAAFDNDGCDETTPLLGTEGNDASVQSAEPAESAATSHEPLFAATAEAKTSRRKSAPTAAGASKSRGTRTVRGYGTDDQTPLSEDFPDFERAPDEPPSRDCNDAATKTEVANARALTRAAKHYGDGMQQVCGDSVSGRISDEELHSHHHRLQVSAREIFTRGCVSAGKNALPHYGVALDDAMAEQFKNFVNQNREKPTFEDLPLVAFRDPFGR